MVPQSKPGHGVFSVRPGLMWGRQSMEQLSWETWLRDGQLERATAARAPGEPHCPPPHGKSSQVPKLAPGIRVVYARDSTDLHEWDLFHEQQPSSGGIQMSLSATRNLQMPQATWLLFFPLFSVPSTTDLYEKQKLKERKITLMKHSG